MPDPGAEKPKVMPKAEALAKLLQHHKQVQQRAAERAKKKAARAEAGRRALTARAAVDQLCSDIEATLDAEQHRALLELAVRESGDAIGSLRSATPIQNPTDWLTSMVSGYEAAALVAKSRALRSDEHRFAAFLAALSRSLADAGAAPAAVSYTQAELAVLPLAEISQPAMLADQCESAQLVLAREADRLQSGSSLAHAWTQVRTAEDILDGTTVLLAPAMCPDLWLNSGDFTVACLCVTAGAAMMTRGFTRMLAEAS